MSIQPGQGQLLGQNPQTSNPLLILANAIEQQTEVFKEIAKNTAPEGRHIYALYEAGPGSFLTYCLACSEAEQHFIFPCTHPTKAPTQQPPGTFTVAGGPPRGDVADILTGD